MDEKRDSFRRPVDICLKFRYAGPQEIKEGSLQVLDVSAGGLGVLCSEDLDIGSVIEVSPDLNTAVKCEIIYQEADFYGLKFIDKNSAGVKTLLAFCKDI